MEKVDATHHGFFLNLKKFIYSEKATKFCKISTLFWLALTEDKSKVEILQNCVAFSKYINFKTSQLSQNLNDIEYQNLNFFQPNPSEIGPKARLIKILCENQANGKE